MAASGERVVCTVCSEKIILKNLKTHYLRQHPGAAVKYESATSGNISKFLFNDGSAAKKKKTEESGEVVTDVGLIGESRPSTSSLANTETDDGHNRSITPGTSSNLFDTSEIQKLLEKVHGK